jgi:tetratricopeptide (TPR) repeat protein
MVHLIRLPLLTALLATIAGGQLVVDERTRREAFQHYRSGVELLTAERWDKALEEFVQAVKLDPLLTDAHYGKGQAYMGLKRFASAADAYEDCIEAARSLHGLRERDRVSADRQLDDEIRELKETLRRMQMQGPTRALRATQLEQRIQDLEQDKRASLGAAFQAPAGVLLALGSAHFRNSDRDQAEHYWSEAVKVNSRLGEAWNNLAVVYLGSGRKKEAEDAVRNAERAGFRVNPRLKDDIRAMKG